MKNEGWDEVRPAIAYGVWPEVTITVKTNICSSINLEVRPVDMAIYSKIWKEMCEE